jgi:DNA processing protein
MNLQTYYQLALSKIPGIGPIRFKKIIEKEPDAEKLFFSSSKYLQKYIGLNESIATAILKFDCKKEIETELAFCEKNNIKILLQSDEHYPRHLKNCIDAPSVLFFRGNYQFLEQKIISIIGTRTFTDYGKRICEELIEQLQPYGVTIVSGLAYGIDIIAHRQAIKQNLATIGVVAHGLDKIYPSAHKKTAMEMMEQGGLLSEFFSGTLPNRENFPTRNRVVAGMSEATIVIETDIKGGSMITAELASSYNKELYCFPGRISDSKSVGCNYLIKSLKASLVTSADDVIQNLGWNTSFKAKPRQRQLFIEMTEDEKEVYAILNEKEAIHIDELLQKCQLNSSQIAGCLLSLEMQNIVVVKPGKMVSIIS